MGTVLKELVRAFGRTEIIRQIGDFFKSDGKSKKEQQDNERSGRERPSPSPNPGRDGSRGPRSL